MPNRDAPTEEEIDELYPDEMEEFYCPVCEKEFNAWRRLHPHMRMHSEGEKERVYEDLGVSTLTEATIHLWEVKQ